MLLFATMSLLVYTYTSQDNKKKKDNIYMFITTNTILSNKTIIMVMITISISHNLAANGSCQAG